MPKLILPTLFFALALGVCSLSLRKLAPYSEPNAVVARQAEVLYLPNGRALQFLSFGYARVLSHLLWFNTISYFAKHWRTDRNYVWLDHMCQLVTRLNPSAQQVYQFCGVMLAWEGQRPAESVLMLSAAMKQFPDNWIFPYLRGFVFAFFLDQQERARTDFVQAAKLPGAHPIVVRLASKNILTLGSPQDAIDFLKEAIESAPDAHTKGVLEDRLGEIFFEMGFRALEAAAQNFRLSTGQPPKSLEQLAASGVLSQAFVSSGYADVFGGHYYWDEKAGVPRSTSSRKRPKLIWKNEAAPATE